MKKFHLCGTIYRTFSHSLCRLFMKARVWWIFFFLCGELVWGSWSCVPSAFRLFSGRLFIEWRADDSRARKSGADSSFTAALCFFKITQLTGITWFFHLSLWASVCLFSNRPLCLRPPSFPSTAHCIYTNSNNLIRARRVISQLSDKPL